MMLRRRQRGERPADGRSRILVDQALCHRIGKHSRDPLAYATHCLQTAAVLDASKRAEDDGNSYRADWHRSDRREYVALEAGKESAA